MPYFRVSPAIFDCFPGMRVAVAVAYGLDNAQPRPAVETLWRQAWQQAAGEGARYGNAQSHPHVLAWRERFRALGVSPKEFPTSIEAMLRRAMKGGAPFVINPAVDFYNAVSLGRIVPAGAFDLATLPAGDLDARLTQPGDSFHGLDAETPVAVPAGETCYASGTAVVTRQFLWRQSRQGLVTPETTTALFLSEVIVPDPGLVNQVLGELVSGLNRYFGVKAVSGIVDAQAPAFGW